MEKINVRINKSDDISLFHDSRSDVKKLSMVINLLIDKINEIVDIINYVKTEERK